MIPLKSFGRMALHLSPKDSGILPMTSIGYFSVSNKSALPYKGLASEWRNTLFSWLNAILFNEIQAVRSVKKPRNIMVYKVAHRSVML
jgi:hypothetical protein